MPTSPNSALAGKGALEHVPLQPTHLVGGSPAEHTAAAAGDRPGRLPCPHLLPSLSRWVLVHELGDESGPAFGAGAVDRALAERGEEGTVLDASLISEIGKVGIRQTNETVDILTITSGEK